MADETYMALTAPSTRSTPPCPSPISSGLATPADILDHGRGCESTEEDQPIPSTTKNGTSHQSLESAIELATKPATTLLDSIAFDDKCVFIEKGPLAVVEDGVRRRLPPPTMPSIPHRHSSLEKPKLPSQSRKTSLSSILASSPRFLSRLSSSSPPTSILPNEPTTALASSLPNKLSRPPTKRSSTAPPVGFGTLPGGMFARRPKSPAFRPSPCCHDCKSAFGEGAGEGHERSAADRIREMYSRGNETAIKEDTEALGLAVFNREKGEDKEELAPDCVEIRDAYSVLAPLTADSSFSAFSLGSDDTAHALATPTTPHRPVLQVTPPVLYLRRLMSGPGVELANLSEDESRTEQEQRTPGQGKLDAQASSPTTSPVSPSQVCKGIWLCSPPPRSLVSPIAIGPIAGLPRNHSATSFSTLTSIRKPRPVVTRAMSTGRLAHNFDEQGTVVCMSVHSGRVLGKSRESPSAWRGTAASAGPRRGSSGAETKTQAKTPLLVSAQTDVPGAGPRPSANPVSLPSKGMPMSGMSTSSGRKGSRERLVEASDEATAKPRAADTPSWRRKAWRGLSVRA